MSVVINTNSAATMAANNLAQSSSLLQKSLNRLSSGSKIVSPADDAGGLAVSMKLDATIRRQGAVQSNVANTNSFLQTQDGVLATVGKVLNRMSELKTFALDPTKNTSDLANYNDEFVQLQAEITSLGAEKFNGIALFGSSGLNVATSADTTSQTVNVGAANLLGAGGGAWNSIGQGVSDWSAGSGTTNDGTTALFTPPPTASLTTTQTNISGPLTLAFDTSGGAPGQLQIQGAGGSITYSYIDNLSHHIVLADNGSQTSISIDGVASGTSSSIGGNGAGGSVSIQASGANATITNLSLTNTAASGNVASVASSSSLSAVSLSTITSAIQDVATYRANNGASQSRLNFAGDVLTTNQANLQAANSRIVDVDVAQESTQLAKYNVLVQAGTAMLSQANQSSQVALKLLG